MSRQASFDYADPIPGRAIRPPREDDRRPCLFVAGPAAFQRKAIWKRLEASGNRVLRLTGPAGALAAIESTSPDVIFCEVTAAPEPVFELLDRLAAVENDACVILMGPDLGAEQVARCLRGGAFDYLTVPASATRVLDALQKGLINRQAFQAVRDLSGQLAQVNASLAGERDVLRQWNIKLSLLNHLTQALAGPLNSESIARSLFNGLAGLVPVDVIGLGRPDPHRVWTWSRTTAYEAQEQRVRAHLLSRFNAQAAPVSQAQTQVLRWSSGLPAFERPAQMTIPLTFSPKSQGLLYVERQQGTFSESELQLLSMVGTSLSLALHNAAIHQQMQELASRDGLTGLLNRRTLEEVLSRELKAGTISCIRLSDLSRCGSLQTGERSVWACGRRSGVDGDCDDHAGSRAGYGFSGPVRRRRVRDCAAPYRSRPCRGARRTAAGSDRTPCIRRGRRICEDHGQRRHCTDPGQNNRDSARMDGRSRCRTL